MLLNPDYWKFVHKISDCLSLCSFNQTCAAMSYDKRTSTCYMSGAPKFLDIREVEPKSFLKEAHAHSSSLLQCGEKGGQKSSSCILLSGSWSMFVHKKSCSKPIFITFFQATEDIQRKDTQCY